MEHLFDSSKSPQGSPKPRPGSLSLTPAQLQAALNSNLSASQKNTLQLMMMQSKKPAMSPVNRTQPVNPRSQHASAVMAMHRMAQQLMMQVNKVDEALKNPNLGAEERERFLAFKAKFEGDLQQLRNSANNQQFVNAARMGQASSTNQPAKIHPRSGTAFPLPSGPPVFPPCPQLSSKVFSSPMHSVLETSISSPSQSSLVSPTFSSRPRTDKIPREATIVEALSGSSKKRKLTDLFRKAGFSEELDSEAESVSFTTKSKAFLKLADNFIDRLTYMACRAAKHRNSSSVQIKDFQLELGNFIIRFILERQWNLYIPGFSDEVRGFRKPILHSVHSSRQAIVSRSKYETAAQARSQATFEHEHKSSHREDGDDEDLILVNSATIDRDL